MSRYVYYQPNKLDLKDTYGDCVIRSFCKAEGLTWLEVFDGLIPYARRIQSYPNTREVYEVYLADRGFIWKGVSVKKGKKRPTVDSFAKDNKVGTYILRCAHHLVTVVDGKYYDTWDSGESSVYGWWYKNVD